MSFTQDPGINLLGLGNLSISLEKECVDAMLDSVRTTLRKLTDPKEFLNIKVSGAIVDEIVSGGGFGAIFSADFASKYGADIGLAVLSGSSEYIKDKTGYSPEELVGNALETAFTFINTLVMANNTVFLVMMKVIAANIVKQVNSKLEREKNLRIYLVALHNVVMEVSKGDPIFNRYLENLRQALLKVTSAKNKLIFVRNTFDSRNIWLSRSFEDAKTLMADARMLVRPSTGGNPYTEPFYSPGRSKTDQVKSLAKAPFVTGGRLLQEGTGFPTTGSADPELADKVKRLKESPSAIKPEEMDLIDNIMLIPILTSKIIDEMRDYSAITASINGMIATFIGGSSVISTAFYSAMKKFFLQQIQNQIDLVTGLEGSMSYALNSKDNVYRTPVKLTAMSFKWVTQMSAIISILKLMPTKGIKTFGDQLNDVKAYTDAVKALKSLDTINTGIAVLQAQDAQEDVGNFERQMLTGLLRSNAVIAQPSSGKAVVPLLRALISRVDLATSRDTTIKNILQTFIDYPIEGEKELNRMLNSVNDILKKAGLDRALDLWATGDYAKFFGLTAQTATYVGAALEGIALLKKCIKDKGQGDEGDKFDALELKFRQQQDLLDVKIGFDFDKILKANLKLCEVNAKLTTDIDVKEMFCNLAEQAYGSIFKPLKGLVTTPEKASGS